MHPARNAEKAYKHIQSFCKQLKKSCGMDTVVLTFYTDGKSSIEVNSLSYQFIFMSYGILNIFIIIYLGMNGWLNLEGSHSSKPTKTGKCNQSWVSSVSMLKRCMVCVYHSNVLLH